MKSCRWDEGLAHLGEEVPEFLDSLLSDGTRNVLYIAGAGFDPRAAQLPRIVAGHEVSRRGIFIREERPNPDPELVRRGDENARALRGLYPTSDVIPVHIFDEEHAVVGGQRVCLTIRDCLSDSQLHEFTDVIVDISALSIGVSFPIVGLLFEKLNQQDEINLHVVAAASPQSGHVAEIAEFAERYQHPKGFKGERSEADDSVQLWLPQLTSAKKRAFSNLYKELEPREVCPIFPFPCHEPRQVEQLLEDFSGELTDEWGVDLHQMLFAAEHDPLDLYRTIARVHVTRKDVYDRAGRLSATVLSPIGSKAQAIGALMAALEFDLPVAYVEARRFVPTQEPACLDLYPTRFVHVWLLGEVYPLHRSGASNDT